jgi:hypothetical protein
VYSENQIRYFQFLWGNNSLCDQLYTTVQCHRDEDISEIIETFLYSDYVYESFDYYKRFSYKNPGYSEVTKAVYIINCCYYVSVI